MFWVIGCIPTKGRHFDWFRLLRPIFNFLTQKHLRFIFSDFFGFWPFYQLKSECYPHNSDSFQSHILMVLTCCKNRKNPATAYFQAKSDATVKLVSVSEYCWQKFNYWDLIGMLWDRRCGWQNRHQNILSPTSVTNIDVTDSQQGIRCSDWYNSGPVC